jgi:prepilin-type N-terminal cleavage/methylation domain-containing protein
VRSEDAEYEMKRGLQRAFTLVELLVVIAIIAMLAAFVVARAETSQREGQCGRLHKQPETMGAGVSDVLFRLSGHFPRSKQP